jgi:hypothetical protein
MERIVSVPSVIRLQRGSFNIPVLCQNVSIAIAGRSAFMTDDELIIFTPSFKRAQNFPSYSCIPAYQSLGGSRKDTSLCATTSTVPARYVCRNTTCWAGS